MGERQNEPFQLSFNASLKVDFQGSRVTSDGGLILVRELDERLGVGDLIAKHLSDAGAARTLNFLWPICSASPSTAAWRAMRTSMMPSGSGKIRPFG
jgi:hypothetical protein